MKNKLLILLLSYLCFACSSEQDCFVADQHELMKSLTINEQEYGVYLRTTGFQEKEFFYVLYPGLPTFDSCGNSSSEALAIEHLDLTQGYPAKIFLEESTMSVEYAGSNSNEIRLSDIPIEPLKTE